MSIRQTLALYCICALLLPGCASRQIDLSARPDVPDEERLQQIFSAEPQLRAVFGTPEGSSVLTQDTSLRPDLPATSNGESAVRAELATGQQLLASGRYTDAILLLSRLEGRGQNSPEILLALARAWMNSGNLGLSRGYAEQALNLYGPSAETSLVLGEILFRAGEIDRSQEVFNSAYRSRPEDIRILRWMATVRLELKDWEGARSYLQRAISQKPGNWTLREMMAKALVLLGKEDRAVEQLSTVMPRSRALDIVGSIYLEQEQWEKARRVIQMAVAADPTLATARLNLQEAESHLAPPAVVNLSSFREYRLKHVALRLKLNRQRLDDASPAVSTLMDSETIFPEAMPEALTIVTGNALKLQTDQFTSEMFSLDHPPGPLPTALLARQTKDVHLSPSGEVEITVLEDSQIAPAPIVELPEKSTNIKLEEITVTVTVQLPEESDHWRTLDSWHQSDEIQISARPVSLTGSPVDTSPAFQIGAFPAVMVESEIQKKHEDPAVRPQAVPFEPRFEMDWRRALGDFLRQSLVGSRVPSGEGFSVATISMNEISMPGLDRNLPSLRQPSALTTAGRQMNLKSGRSHLRLPGFEPIMGAENGLDDGQKLDETENIDAVSESGFWSVMGMVALMVLMILVI